MIRAESERRAAKPATAPSLRRWLVGAPLSAVIAVLPIGVNVFAESPSTIMKPYSAAAKDGGDDSDSGGDSGHGGGDDGGGDSGPGGGGDDDDDGDDRDDRRDDREEREDRREDAAKERRTGPNGEKIERSGDRIRILYPDGYREEIEDGRFEMKDPQGRTVIKRAATSADLARIEALLR